MGILTWFKGLASLRNIAILAGVLGLAFATQSLRIKYKSNKIEKLQAEITQLDIAIELALSANESNMLTIESQSKELQQCVYKRDMNETQAITELQNSNERIVDLKSKYEKLRNEMPKMGNCVTPTVTDDVIAILHAARNSQD